MSCCDEYCSNYGCNQGRDCPVRKTRHMNITVYTKSNCPNCVSAKNLLRSKNILATYIDCDNPYEFDGLRDKYPQARQLPAVIINDQYVGGFAGLQAALKQLGV
jgi:glutaredoxin 3